MEKRCSKCKEFKDYEFFQKDPSNKKHGRTAACKTCVKKYREINKERHAANYKAYFAKPEKKEKRAAQQRQYFVDNPEYFLYKAARARSAKYNIKFDITVEDIVIPDLCPILKVKMVKHTEYAASLDKIDPTKGYTKGNVVVISRKANMMKHHATFEELLEFCKNVPEFYNKLINNK